MRACGFRLIDQAAAGDGEWVLCAENPLALANDFDLVGERIVLYGARYQILEFAILAPGCHRQGNRRREIVGDRFGRDLVQEPDRKRRSALPKRLELQVIGVAGGWIPALP